MEIININYFNINFLEDFINNKIPNTFRYFNNKSPQEIIKNHYITLIYIEDKKSVGYAHIDFDGLKYWFGICILQEYQGKGIGSKLIHKILQDFNTSNIQKLYLSVDKTNITALKLYIKNGFQIWEERNTLYIMYLERK